MNLETLLFVSLLFVAFVLILITFKTKKKFILGLIVFIILTIAAHVSISMYRHGVFGTVQFIDGPVQTNLPSKQYEVKKNTPPEIKNEKRDVWKDAKEGYNENLRKEWLK